MATTNPLPRLEIENGVYRFSFPDNLGLTVEDVYTHPLTRKLEGLCTPVGPSGPMSPRRVEFFTDRSVRDFQKHAAQMNGNLQVNWTLRLDFVGAKIREILLEESRTTATPVSQARKVKDLGV
jgi:hypothetical protein